MHLPVLTSSYKFLAHENPKTAHKTHRKDLKTSNLTCTVLLVQRKFSQKCGFLRVPIGCVRFARNCGKMYGRHLFLYGGFEVLPNYFSGTKFGQGVYFARDAKYSVGYAGSGSGTHYMYLARVLVGQYCAGNSDMVMPPPKDPSRPEVLYDSVVDQISNPSIFVVFYMIINVTLNTL